MSKETEQSLERIVAVRGAHRGVLTRLVREAEELLESLENVIVSKESYEYDRLQILSGLIESKGKLLESLDENVLTKAKIEDIEDEVKESSLTAEKIIEVRRKITKFLKKTEEDHLNKAKNLSSVENASETHLNISMQNNTDTQSGTNVQGNTDTQIVDTQASTSSHTVTDEIGSSPIQNAPAQVKVAKPRLPKLCLPKFRGDVKKWSAFWESFESLVHKNAEMSPIDKFNYLNSLLEGDAARAIQGLPLTNANYAVAVEILKDRFGKPQTIITAHMDDLLKLPTLSNNCRVRELRSVLDKLTIHVRGLETLGISAQQYGSLLTPIVMSKIPPDIRLIIARKKVGSVLELKEITELLKAEVEARETSIFLKMNENNYDKKSGGGGYPERGKEIATGAFLNNSNSQTASVKCVFCSKQHFSASCSEISDIPKRKEILLRDKRCFLCLRKGHRASECERETKCRKCSKRHHQSICYLGKAQQQQVPNSTDKSSQHSPQATDPQPKDVRESTTLSAANFTAKSTVVLQTATASARGTTSSKTVPVRILFDGGSQRSYITKDLKDRLGLQAKNTETLNLSTFGDKILHKQKCEVVELELFKEGGETLCVSALTFPTICRALPSKVDINQCVEFASLELASDPRLDGQPIDILIGSDLYWQFITGNIIRGKADLVAIESKFGWILSGAVEGSSGTIMNDNGSSVSNLIMEREIGGRDEADDLKSSLQQFWETEAIGIHESPEEICSSLEHEEFRVNIENDGERYAVNLPWKSGVQPLTDHYDLSKTRLAYLQRGLEKDKVLLGKYNDIIEEQLESGIIEPVLKENVKKESSAKVHYMPHHAVVREDKSTTKVRIVFNGSAKSSPEDLSINECLERGPNIIPSLFDILTRFRSHPYALVADIEKAFHMISIKEDDRDALRFLWLKSVDQGLTEIVVYRFCRLVFGLKPSPAILGATIRHHLSSCSEPESQVIKVLENDLYVDDLATGTDTEDEAVHLFKSARTVMSKGGFNLRKWNCNSTQVRKVISECENEENVNNRIDATSEIARDNFPQISVKEDDASYVKISVNPLGGNESNKVKVLGVTWNFVNDTLQYGIQELIEFARLLPLTKRSVLKLSARIFDPLGLITPFTISLKILFQELCLDATDWDVDLPPLLKEKWNKMIEQLPLLIDIEVPRNCFASKANRNTVEIHGFSDASTKAYAAAIYIRVIIGHVVQTKLMCARSRVAPVKVQTIPRLELLGAVLLARLMDSLRKALSDSVPINNVYYWTDSITVLCWIQNQRPWKQYVMRRVNEIRSLTHAVNWKHCPGEWNPADLATRGLPVNQLKENSLWWTGPEYLKSEEVIYQEISKEKSLQDKAVLQEQTKVVIPTTHVFGLSRGEPVMSTSLKEIMDCKTYSNLHRLLRVTSYVVRFIHNLQSRVTKNEIPETGTLTANEVNNARNLWLKTVQLEIFAKEFESIKTGSESNYVRQFNLYVDEQGVLRCKGRIENSSLSADTVNPVLLPNNHHLTELIIRDVHSRMMHSGVKSTLTAIRDTYWIPRGREVVKKFIRHCLVCTKHNGKPFPHSVPPSLPESRVDDGPPWTNTGVDYAGPLYVKKRNSSEKGITEKVWLCLFTCASTRGIHLELVENCSAEQFLLAFRRFVGRRGLPRLMMSDNAKNFKTSAKEITKIGRSTIVQEHISNIGVQWMFIIEKAPWWGGFWERLIKLTKDCIKKVVGRAVLTFEELRTLLTEVEAVVNARPLTYVYDDVDGTSYALSPAHLMNGRRITACQNGESYDVISTHESLTKRARHHRRLLRQFMNQWKHEYLTSLRENARITRKNEPCIVVGDLVILKKEGTARCFWKIAKVTKLLNGKDGKTRAAEIRVMTSDGMKCASTLRRPIQLLIPIEVKSSNEVKKIDTPKENKKTETPKKELNPEAREFVPSRVRREAAVIGEAKRRTMNN